jgi:hypothetical protein
MFPMSGFRLRFPTVTPWTTDRDLPDIVFRACFTIVLSDRGQVDLSRRRPGPRGPGDWRAADRPPAARVLGWTGDMVGWTAFVQVAGMAEAAAPGLWPGSDGRGRAWVRHARSAGAGAVPVGGAPERGVTAGPGRRPVPDPASPVTSFRVATPARPGPGCSRSRKMPEVGDPPPRRAHVPERCRRWVIRRPGGPRWARAGSRNGRGRGPWPNWHAACGAWPGGTVRTALPSRPAAHATTARLLAAPQVRRRVPHSSHVLPTGTSRRHTPPHIPRNVRLAR